MGFLGTTGRGCQSELVPVSIDITLPFVNVIDLDKEQEFLSAATF